MINFLNTKFIKSCTNYNEAPGLTKPEVLLCGKSNVGKSSLINAITGHNSLAFTSSKPGHTKLLNYFDVDSKFYLIDSPGYGYAKGNVDLDTLFKNLMDNYFSNSKQIKLIILLLNSERTINDLDEELLNYLKSHNLPVKVVFTKVDKLNQKELSALKKYSSTLEIEEPIYISIRNSNEINKLRKTIETYIK